MCISGVVCGGIRVSYTVIDYEVLKQDVKNEYVLILLETKNIDTRK